MENDKSKVVPFAPAMVSRLKAMQTEHNNQILVYLQNCADALQLTGEYTSSLKLMAFVPKDDKKE